MANCVDNKTCVWYYFLNKTHERMRNMFCGNCGKEIPDGALFCEECGAKNSEEIKEVEVTPEYCAECGTLIDDGSGVCPACGHKSEAEMPTEETSSNKMGEFLKKLKGMLLRKKVIVPVAIVAAVVVAVSAAYPYAKNALAKLFMSEEKYFAHVVADNAEDFSGALGYGVGAMKNCYTKGLSEKGELDIEVGKGVSTLLDDLDAGEVEEYITWLKKASLKMEASFDDSKFGATYDVSVNGKDLGKFNMIIDMSNMSYYFGVPDYNPDYICYEESYYENESYEMLEKIGKALPNEAKTEKIIKRYVKAVASGVEDVEETTEVIEAEGVSQKVTVLSFDIDGATARNAGLSVLEELKEDKEVKKIVEGVIDATDEDVDVDELWDELDDAIDELEEMDPDDLGTVATVELYVDSKGEIVGFKVEADEFTVASYSAVKGAKYGSVTEIRSYDFKAKLAGSGKAFGNKRTGEYAVKVSGISVVEFDIKNVDTELLEKGIFNGSITFKVPEAAASMLSYEIGDDMADALSKLSVTFTSKQRKYEKASGELVIKYGKEECLKLSVTGSETNAKKVKEPKNYINAEDYDEIEEWVSEFKFDALIKKLQKANFPDEVIEAVEEMEDSF